MTMCSMMLIRRSFPIIGCRNLWINSIQNNEAYTRDHGFQKESDEHYEDNIKTKILSASLNHVDKYGWHQQAISAGAESIGYPGVIHGLFPNGGADLVQYFQLNCHKQLNDILDKKAIMYKELPLKDKKSPEELVCEAVEIRLRMIVPFKKSWPQAMALMTLPSNIPTSLANLLTLVDDICYHAGDRSVDFNWYTRRIILAGIYKTTELYMLQDSSEDHKNTWQFLTRQIEDVSHLYQILSMSVLSSQNQPMSRSTESITAAFTTARNILGLNWKR